MAGTGTPVITKPSNSDNHGTCACTRLRTRRNPQITPIRATSKATGLVFLPGAMTSLILADIAPLQAVLVQAVVMFLVLAATATTTVVIALGLIRRLFTPGHRLIYLPAPADG
jgi:putative ABC transport system permease protein